MALIPPANGGNSSRKPIKAGAHQAVCIGIYDIGTHENTYMGETKLQRQVILNFEFPKLRRKIETDDGEKDIPYTKAKWYTFSYNEKSNLAKDLEKWRGRSLTKAEEKSFDLASMLGKNAIITITNKFGDDGQPISDRIVSIGQIMEGMEEFKPELEMSKYGIQEHGRTFPEWVPEWVQNKVKECREWSFMKDAAEKLAPAVTGDVDFGLDTDEIPF